MQFRRIYKFFALIRFTNLIILFFTQFLIKAFIISKNEKWRAIFSDSHFFILSLSTLLVAAGGYIINDYYDIKIDLVNKPGKLIVGKFISRRMALIWHLSLSFTGIVAGFYNGTIIGTIHLCAAFILWLYSNRLKRLPLAGNLSVAFLSALSVFLLAVLYRQNYEIIVVYSLFAFYISLIREIIKDMEDIRGDAVFGCRTLPIIWGFRKTKKLILLILVIFIVNLFLMFYQFRLPVIIYFVFMVVTPLVSLQLKLNRADTLKDFKLLSRYCKFIMCTGLGSILFLN
jgi:4-hydroxybenzoate polyprenyltransferase